ncbi:hypothetical protein BGZ92_004479 [Podila epicladia]|nr:hypothetical protein BGZ92_004479 [Podila epicladia]
MAWNEDRLTTACTLGSCAPSITTTGITTSSAGTHHISLADLTQDELEEGDSSCDTVNCKYINQVTALSSVSNNSSAASTSITVANSNVTADLSQTEAYEEFDFGLDFEFDCDIHSGYSDGVKNDMGQQLTEKENDKDEYEPYTCYPNKTIHLSQDDDDEDDDDDDDDDDYDVVIIRGRVSRVYGGARR